METFVRTNDNIKIAFNLYSNNKDSVVVICPGWFMTKDSRIFKLLALDFSKYYDVIVMDFRGHGKSSGFYTFSAKEQFDLDAVINYIKTNYTYKNVFLCGFSLGAAVVLNYCAISSGISKAIAVSAPADFMKIENRMYLPDAWIPTLFQKFEPLRWLSIRPGFPLLKKEKPIDSVDKIKIPTLFVAGEKDPTVFPWHTKVLFDKAKCPKKYELFTKARHAEDIYNDFHDEFMELCINWFTNNGE